MFVFREYARVVARSVLKEVVTVKKERDRGSDRRPYDAIVEAFTWFSMFSTSSTDTIRNISYDVVRTPSSYI